MTWASVVGIYLSFFIDSAPAPTIVLILSAIFIGAFVIVTRNATVTEASAAN